MCAGDTESNIGYFLKNGKYIPAFPGICLACSSLLKVKIFTWDLRISALPSISLGHWGKSRF